MTNERQAKKGDGQASAKATRKKSLSPGTAAEGTTLKQRDVSQILQSAYREALNEDIPPDMLDLLNRLS